MGQKFLIKLYWVVIFLEVIAIELNLYSRTPWGEIDIDLMPIWFAGLVARVLVYIFLSCGLYLIILRIFEHHNKY